MTEETPPNTHEVRAADGRCACCSRTDDDEPSDDEIYNGPGREGGIGFEEEGIGEHDWRL